MMRSTLLALVLLNGVASFSAPHHQPQSDRRDFLAQVATVTAAATLSTATNLATPQPAHAVGGLNKVNAKLKAFGLPPVSQVADGFSPILEVYGKGKNRFPILVTFNHPLSWVITLPSNNVNGEDGTIQVGDYAKGDTATFFVYEEPGHVDNLSKEMVEKTLTKCISQKGENMYENFKITKTDSFTKDGQTYTLADFKYSLLTGAGFVVDRKGVASLTSEGNAVEALWAASTAIRYKKTEQTLRDIVTSFRCYTEGIKLDDELYG